MKARKTLEINPKHPIIKDLNRRIQEGEDNSVISNVVSLLYDTAALQAGFSVEEPRSFVTSINRLLKLCKCPQPLFFCDSLPVFSFVASAHPLQLSTLTLMPKSNSMKKKRR